MTKILLLILITISTYSMESDIDRSQIRSDSITNSNNLSEFAFNESMTFGGYNDLIPFITSAPDQEEAGSCLYMSHTATIEWWLNSSKNLTGENKIKLSERYYMALKTQRIGQENIKNWRTDNIERLNTESRIIENKYYPFTKGYFLKDRYDRRPTDKLDKDALYNTEYNWISFKEGIDKDYFDKFISLPKFKREVIYVDPDRNQWNVGQAPKDIVEKIKAALVKNAAPVNVIYNHDGFWHAVVIAGFNDNAPTHGCPYIENYKSFMDKRAFEIELSANNAQTQEEKVKLLNKASRSRVIGYTANQRYQEDGGCNKTGVFYVRDSITPDYTLPLYDYDPTQVGEEEHLNAPIIFRSYQWFNSTGNHAFQILLK